MKNRLLSLTILLFAVSSCDKARNEKNIQNVVNDLAARDASFVSPNDSPEKDFDTTLDSMLNAIDPASAILQKAHELSERENNELWAATIGLKKGDAYFFKDWHETALSCYTEALLLASLHNNIYLPRTIYFHLGNCALMVFDFDKAESYAHQSLEISRQFGQAACCPDFLLFSKLEMMKGNHGKSEDYAQKALQIAIEFDAPEVQRLCYLLLSELAVAQRKYRENIDYLKEMDLVEKTVSKKTSLRAAEGMAAKYETEKKEFKIRVLEDEKRSIRLFGIFGGLVLLLALTVFFFLWRWTVQKREFAETRIKQLEQEKQLVATQAVLDGETAERTRLARDLHDGLGGKLTGIKLHLQQLRQGAQLDGADVKQFEQAMDMLDASLVEMRRVSHNLMPDTLSHFGLKKAVSDFCRSMSPIIVFNHYGAETRLDPKFELLIYRCIHELVNNALKYSGASQIVVQIIRDERSINFTVQDNGCGFDTSFESKGTGLKNIRTRVASFGGNIQIDSGANKGTEVNVELRIC